MRTLYLIIALLFWGDRTAEAQGPPIPPPAGLLDTVPSDTAKARLLEGLAVPYAQRGSFDTARAYARQAFELADRAAYERGRGNAKSTQGVVAYFQGNYAEALEHYKAADAIRQRLDFPKDIAQTYLRMGAVHYALGRHTDALKYYLDGLAISNAEHDTLPIIKFSNNIGVIQAEQGDSAAALRSYARALELGKIKVDTYPKGLTDAYNNLGNLYQTWNDLPAATRNYRDALGFLEALAAEGGPDRTGDIADCYNNIGGLCYKQGDYTGAQQNFQEAFTRYQAVKDIEGITGCYINFGDVALAQGDPAAARRQFDRALVNAKELGSFDDLMRTYGGLTAVDSAQGNCAGAFAHYKLHIAFRDSVSNRSTKDNVRDLQRTFEFKESQIADSLQHANELGRVEDLRTIERLRADKNRNRAVLLGTAIIVILILGGMAVYLDRKRRQARFAAEQARKEREYRERTYQLRGQVLGSQMDQHFTFNIMNSINGFILQDDKQRAVAINNKFAALLRSMFRNGAQDLVPLQKEIDAAKLYLEVEDLRLGDAFDHAITLSPGLEDVLVPPMILQPFLENAVNHGVRPATYKVLVSLSVQRRSDDLCIIVEDDGVGRRPSTTTGDAADLHSTKVTRERLELIRQATGRNAGFEVQDLPKGTRIIITLPLYLAA